MYVYIEQKEEETFLSAVTFGRRTLRIHAYASDFSCYRVSSDSQVEISKIFSYSSLF